MEKQIERLTTIMNEEFIREHKDLDNLDAIYAAVLEKDGDISREAFDAFVETLSAGMDAESGEISEAGLEEVSGGIAWETVGAVCGLLTLCYKGGEAIGKAIYYAKRKK